MNVFLTININSLEVMDEFTVIRIVLQKLKKHIHGILKPQ